jgi:putative DNA primase/helicase
MSGRENERSFYLEAWSGDSSYTSDRVERGTTRTENACVSVFGTIQPGKLDEYLRSAMAKGGKGNDGLINRFQLLVYPEPKTTWEEVDQVPDPEEAANYLNTARRIAFAAPEDLGAETGVTGIPFLRFSTEDGAQDRFRRWQKAHMNRLFGGDEHPLMEDHLGKYVSLVPSLALVFHLIDVGTGPVQDASLKRAIEYVAYLEGHARRLFASNIEEDVTTAKLILKKLISGKLALTFQARDVYRAGWSGLGETEMVLRGIKCLVEFGYAQETKSETGATWFHAHPELP